MARNEIGDRARQRFWLVAVRRMAAIREYDDFAVPDARVDAGDLRERTVLVVFALHCEYGALQPVQHGLD
jgi:hypothetical protein